MNGATDTDAATCGGDAGVSETSATESDSRWSVRETFKKWELLRLIYNRVWFPPSLALLAPWR